MKTLNELIHEDSPYLRQHAHNPVHWKAWNEQALTQAKESNKLIFLSIGYSTCHWCHVMEKESFEDELSAEILNRDYISIKVDREEMPDLDKYYQDVHYLLNRRAGGWPLSIIMTPDQKVIFAATYLPPVSSHGRMGFRDLLTFIKDKFHHEYAEIQKSALSIEAAIKQYEKGFDAYQSIDVQSLCENYVANVAKSYDETYKGIGSAPKFPHASTWNALLECYVKKGYFNALYMCEDTLEMMAKGGINDQIEGGFYRYSVDEAWVIPHFEKMLYTNAELLEVYAKAFKITQKPLFKTVVNSIIHAMDERFLSDGLYLSASDADSEGEEGKYFVFSYEPAKEALVRNGFSDDEAQAVLAYLSITKVGNFEHRTSNPCIAEDAVPLAFAKARAILKQERQKVAYPFIDTKVLMAWNALFVTALFEAEAYEKAQTLLNTLLKSLHVNGVLYHQVVQSSTLKVEGLLEDYAFVIEALLRAYEHSKKEDYRTLAIGFAKDAMKKFYRDGSWYLSNKAFRAKAVLEDNSYKSPLATMIKNLFEIAHLENDAALHNEAKTMLERFGSSLMHYPHAYPEAVRLAVLYM